MSDCPVCCDIPGYTQHTCERAEFEPESKNEEVMEAELERLTTITDIQRGQIADLTVEYNAALKLIADAPHHPDCGWQFMPMTADIEYNMAHRGPCDCWKSKL
jgi:hypothetical protein